MYFDGSVEHSLRSDACTFGGSHSGVTEVSVTVDVTSCIGLFSGVSEERSASLFRMKPRKVKSPRDFSWAV